jgi:hypothetical protein
MISSKYFYLGNNGIGVEGMDWLHLNEWNMLKDVWAYPLPNISIMPFVAYTWNSYKNIKDYTKNKYILNEM